MAEQGGPRHGFEQAVLAAHQGVYDAIEAGDIDLMRSLWVDDPSTLCVHPGAEPVRGTSAVLRSWSVVMANTGYIQFILTDVTIASPHDDLAVVSCTENVLAEAEGEPVDSFAGGKAVATSTFLRRDGQWRLWVRHASPVATPAEEES